VGFMIGWRKGNMSDKIKPLITQTDIDQAGSDAWDILLVFIDKYYEQMETDDIDEIVKCLNPAQQTLILYSQLYGQVTNGGFVQLIANGYFYLLDSTFAHDIALWGAKGTAAILERCVELYQIKKDHFRNPQTAAEFSAMYKQYPEFEPLSDEFFEIMDSETETIKSYVLENIGKFA
jgi:hypothetical protein